MPATDPAPSTTSTISIHQLKVCGICFLQQSRIITKLRNTAGFPKQYTPDQFRTDEIDFPEGISFDTLMDLDFYDQGKNVIMYGGTGTGKTMLSILIGTEACKRGIPVKFYRTAGLINQFTENQQRGTLSLLKRKLNSAQIIILDEFGYVPYDRTGFPVATSVSGNQV